MRVLKLRWDEAGEDAILKVPGTPVHCDQQRNDRCESSLWFLDDGKAHQAKMVATGRNVDNGWKYLCTWVIKFVNSGIYLDTDQVWHCFIKPEAAAPTRKMRIGGDV